MIDLFAGTGGTPLGVTFGALLLTDLRIHRSVVLSDEEAALDAETEAQTLVGKFLQNFAQLEQALDQGIAKLLGLQGGAEHIVCSSIPFAKKLGVFFSSEGLLGSLPDAKRKARLSKTRSAILEMNTRRVMFAHSPFSSAGSGRIVFRRVVADQKLSISSVELTAVQIDTFCAQLQGLGVEIESLVVEMKPFAPALDFSDPRNSGLIALF